MLLAASFSTWSLADPGGGGGSTPSWTVRYVPSTYPTIQEAVDAADSGDVIEIAEGYHRDCVSVTSKSLTIRGVADTVVSWRPDSDYGDEGPLLSVTGGASVYVRGIIFQSSHPDVTEAFDGRAIVVNGSTLFVDDCVFQWCEASWIDDTTPPASGPYLGGGAIDAVDASIEVTHCLFDKCHAIYGGAIRCAGSTDAEFSGSVFRDCGDLYSAGAIYLNDSTWSGADYTIRQCKFLDCTSTYGSGAVESQDADTYINRCVIERCSGAMSAVNATSFGPGMRSDIIESYCMDCWRTPPNPHAALNVNGSLAIVGWSYICGCGANPAQLTGGAWSNELYINTDDCSSCEGDVSFDGDRGVYDLLELLTYWGQHDPICDLNNDDIVDASDLYVLMVESGFGGWCD